MRVYIERKRLTKVEIVGGGTYEYSYDDKNRLTEVKLDGKTIQSYEYDTYDRLIKEKNNNNGQKTRYQYISDNKDLIEMVYYVTDTGTETLKYQFEYDDYEK